MAAHATVDVKDARADVEIPVAVAVRRDVLDVTVVRVAAETLVVDSATQHVPDAKVVPDATQRAKDRATPHAPQTAIPAAVHSAMDLQNKNSYQQISIEIN